MWLRKRLKRLFSGRRLLQLGFVTVCILVIVYLISFLKLPNSNSFLDGPTGTGRICWIPRSHRTTADEDGQCCNCAGWRSKFVASEDEARVFQSVRLEHVDLLRKLNEAQVRLETVNRQIPVKEAQLRELEMRIGELKLLRKEYSDRRSVQLRLPHTPLINNADDTTKTSQKIPKLPHNVLLEDSFDFSRCSISDPSMPLFIYPLPINSTQLAVQVNRQFIQGQQIASITTDATRTCLFVALINGKQSIDGLTHFGQFGHNHLLLDFSGKLRPDEVGTSMLVSPTLTANNFRPSIDLVAHLQVPEPDPNRWQSLPALLPITRKYLIRFVANPKLLSPKQLTDLDMLRKSMDSAQDTHLIDLECPDDSSSSSANLCYAPEQRLRMGRQSVFTILFPELPSFQLHFYESLEAGSIPVVCSLHFPLPFGDLIDWRQAALSISPARFPELHFILRSLPPADWIELKRKGRFFFEHYLADSEVLVRAILSTLRVRLQIPGGELPEPNARPLFGNWTYPQFISTATKPPYDDEYLGPIEVPSESPSYTHNFTALSLYSGILWSQFPMLLGHSPRFLPSAYFLPSDSEFSEDTAFGMRPIAPGSGQEFALALGGNVPREQFTIVIVTYNREQVLLNTLERLNNLPYLNRVVVIWNDVDRSPSTPAWPRLHVPVLFVNSTTNSLNNRFIPYRQIETEAVLSMDDDIDLKQYEIMFAFRVWRENRDRIVGFPARYHARFGDDNYYNSNHTCQYSMILTGAAFIHKFFLHAYTYHMPAIIRQKVDEWMNCEDLAMNFLVAHLTRKAPIKTTSKWTLRCPSCPEMLSNDEAHFAERHDCLRFFARVYGYNPLVFSQFRADSVLFKTRVPPNHQKCFRYV